MLPGQSNTPEYQIHILLEAFPNKDISVERGKLNQIYRIVLQLLQFDLKTETLHNHSQLGQPDSDGRTSLHWAAVRGDSQAVRILLNYGASPNTLDRISQGPLRSSMKADEPECMKLLIDAGANVN